MSFLIFRFSLQQLKRLYVTYEQGVWSGQRCVEACLCLILWFQSGLYLLYVTQRVLPCWETSPMRQQRRICRIFVKNKLDRAPQNPQVVRESQTRALCAVTCWFGACCCSYGRGCWRFKTELQHGVMFLLFSSDLGIRLYYLNEI